MRHCLGPREERRGRQLSRDTAARGREEEKNRAAVGGREEGLCVRLMVRKVGEEAGVGPAINVAAVSFN